MNDSSRPNDLYQEEEYGGLYNEPEQIPNIPLRGGIFFSFSHICWILSIPFFLCGYVFRLSLSFTPFDILTLIGPSISIIVSATGIVLICITLIRMRSSTEKKPWKQILLALILNLVFFAGSSLLSSNYTLKQGLASSLNDSASRTTLQAIHKEDGPEITPQIMKQVKRILFKRLDPHAYGWVKIQTMNNGRLSIELDSCVCKNRQGLIDLAIAQGKLEFRILPSPDKNRIGGNGIRNYEKHLIQNGPDNNAGMEYLWKKIHPSQAEDFYDNYYIIGEWANEKYVLSSNRPDEIMLQSHNNPWGLQGACLGSDCFGNPAVDFVFDPSGSEKFQVLTRNNLEHSCAILIDDMVLTAPTIKSVISCRGQITGRFTYAYVTELIQLLNTPPLPVELRVIEDSKEK